jgi:hypothetical protein
MLHKRDARLVDISDGGGNRRWTILSSKAHRAKTGASRSFRAVSSVTETDLRTRLGKALARHDALGHSKNSAAEKRRRPEGRGRASLRSIHHGTNSPQRIIEHGQRELLLRVTCLIRSIAELPLNGRLQIIRRHGFGSVVSSGRLFIAAELC